MHYFIWWSANTVLTRALKPVSNEAEFRSFIVKSVHATNRASYTSEAYHPKSNNRIVKLVREGMGFRSISRVLRISLKTILHRVLTTADRIVKPFHGLRNSVYELDELWAFVARSHQT